MAGHIFGYTDVMVIQQHFVYVCVYERERKRQRQGQREGDVCVK